MQPEALEGRRPAPKKQMIGKIGRQREPSVKRPADPAATLLPGHTRLAVRRRLDAAGRGRRAFWPQPRAKRGQHVVQDHCRYAVNAGLRMHLRQQAVVVNGLPEPGGVTMGDEIDLESALIEVLVDLDDAKDAAALARREIERHPGNSNFVRVGVPHRFDRDHAGPGTSGDLA